MNSSVDSWAGKAVRQLRKRFRKQRARRGKYARWAVLEALESRVMLSAVPENVGLLNDTGTPGDLVTSDQRISGVVNGDFYSGWAALEVDLDADGLPNGLAIASWPGQQVTYDPALVNFVGQLTLREDGGQTLFFVSCGRTWSPPLGDVSTSLAQETKTNV